MPQGRPAECVRVGVGQGGRCAGKDGQGVGVPASRGRMNLILPWPPKGLSPNARRHYMALARTKKSYREACAWTAKQQGAARLKPGALSVHLEFVPPDRRARDWDNMLAAVKSGLDGLADVLGVDDRHWRISFNVADEIGGMVRVRVEHETTQDANQFGSAVRAQDVIGAG